MVKMVKMVKETRRLWLPNQNNLLKLLTKMSETVYIVNTRVTKASLADASLTCYEDVAFSNDAAYLDITLN